MTRFVFIASRFLLLTLFVGGGWYAFTNASGVGDTFATNGINLKIDSTAYYNGVLVPSSTWYLKDLNPHTDKFFNYPDVKPGDFGCNTISMHVKNQDAYMCLDFKNLTSHENGVNEPESEVDVGGDGELLAGTEFFGWVDDGDGVYEPTYEKVLFGEDEQSAEEVLNNKSYPVGDAKKGGACKVNKTKYVSMCWCAGDLVVNEDTGIMTCNPETIGNEAQSDSWNVDVSIRAVPVKDKPYFVCNEEEEEDDKVKICHHTSSKTNPTEIITVSESAVAAHIANHGDYRIENEADEKRCNDEKKNDKDKDKDEDKDKDKDDDRKNGWGGYGGWSQFMTYWHNYLNR